MLCAPAGLKTTPATDAVPPASAAEPNERPVVVSMNVTVPVAAEGVTIAVRLVGNPRDRLGGLPATSTLVFAMAITTLAEVVVAEAA